MRDIAVLLTNKPTDYMDRPLVFEEAVEEINKTARLDFRRSLVFGLRPSPRGRSAGSFPEQRLVIEPTKPSVL